MLSLVLKRKAQKHHLLKLILAQANKLSTEREKRKLKA